jgi:SAM-dependent methyltransferase
MAGHDFPTSREAISKIIDIVSRKKDAKTFYDLGCGRAHVLIAVKRAFPNLSVIGVEKNIFQFFFGRAKAFLSGQKIIFKRKDIFKLNLKEVDIIYLYLNFDILSKIEKKIKREIKTGAIVITNTVFFPDWQPKEIHIVHEEMPEFETLFLYVKE